MGLLRQFKQTAFFFGHYYHAKFATLLRSR